MRAFLQGQCDVLRLLDLSNCKNYIRHAVKYRMERIQDDKAATYRLNTEEASLSSIVTRGFPFITKTAEFTKNPENAVLHSKSAGCYDRFQSNKLPPKRPNDKASAKGILQSENIRPKLIRTRVCFDDDGKQDPCPKQDDLYLKQDLPASSHSLGYKNVQVDDEAANTDIDVGLIGEKIEGNTGVGVFMAVDRLQSGQCFVSKRSFCFNVSLAFEKTKTSRSPFCQNFLTKITSSIWVSSIIPHFEPMRRRL